MRFLYNLPGGKKTAEPRPLPENVVNPKQRNVDWALGNEQLSHQIQPKTSDAATGKVLLHKILTLTHAF